MSSTRAGGLAVLAACLLAFGCLAGSSAVAQGTLIEPDGPAEAGLLTFNSARAGDVDGLAFPLLGNESNQPIEVIGYHLDHVPDGVKVIGYAVYSTTDTNGAYYAIYRYRPADSGTPDLTKFPDYAGRPFSIAPGQDGDKYVMAEVSLSSDVRGMVSGCTVDYTQDGLKYTQDLPCAFSFNSGSS